MKTWQEQGLNLNEGNYDKTIKILEEMRRQHIVYGSDKVVELSEMMMDFDEQRMNQWLDHLEFLLQRTDELQEIPDLEGYDFDEIMEAIEELDYVPDLNARSLTMRDSKLIGVVVPQTEPGDRLMFQNSFYSEVLGSIEYYARQQGYRFVQVKTVAAGHYSEYDATQTAYEHMGFVALEVFPTLWDENNPCLIMVMKL